MKLNPIKSTPMAALAGGIIGAGCMAAANAQLTSYEPFSGYTIGAQVTVTTPSPATSGYTGNWTAIDWGDGHPVVNSGPLSYSGAGYAGGVGNHIGLANAAFDQPNSGRMYRLLDSSLAATASTTGTRYLSWLFQSGNQGVTTYQMLDLYNSNTADPNRNFTAGITQNGGNSGSQYDFGVAEAYTSTGVSVDTGVHLFVVKFDFSASAASDNVTLWLDPTLGAGDPATGGIVVSGKDLVFDRLAISDYDENSANWGEIRWGTTFDSVTTAAVPEPSTFALMGLGALGFLLRRKH